MRARIKLYNAVVNRVPGIKERYQVVRDKNQGAKKIFAWGYLFHLSVQYYLFRNRHVGESRISSSDNGKMIPDIPESSIIRRDTPQQLADKLAQFDVISFDAFDTLLLRNVARPKDVFYLIQETFNYPNLKHLRIFAERQSRIKRYRRYGDYEVTLEEIWDELSQMTGIKAQEGIKAELDAEMKVCQPNPYFLAVLSCLQCKSVKLIICSDMYLSSDKVKRLMEHCGYPEFDEYFISSDCRKSKSDGSIYSFVRKTIGEPLQYVQIGDNEYSDVVQAKKNRFNAFLYINVQKAGMIYRAENMDPIISSAYSGIINTYLYNGMNSVSSEFEFGFIYGGLFVTGYCQFIHRYIVEHDIDRILFLARDGDILEKAYRYLYPDEAEKCFYTYWSRLASTKLSASLIRAHYIERMIQHKIGQQYKLLDIFRTMEIEDMLDAFIMESDQRFNRNTMLDDSNADILKDFINKHWETVCDHYEEELVEGKRYFSHILGGAKKAVAVDVGWVGSGAITLMKLAKEIWHFDCDITGLVAGTCGGSNADYDSTAMDFAMGRLESYLFSAADNRDLWKMHDAAKGHNMIVELLLSSDKKSFRGFRKKEDGNYDFSDTSENIDAKQIQSGIMKFVELYKKHPFNECRISGRDAGAPIAILYKNPRFVEKLLAKSGIRPNIE